MNIFQLIKIEDISEIRKRNLKEECKIRNYVKQTPFIFGCELDISNDILCLLLEYSDVNVRDIFGKNASDYCQSSGNMEMVLKIKYKK